MSKHRVKPVSPFFRFSPNLYNSLVARQRQALRHEHRLGFHQMPPKIPVDMQAEGGTCCSDVSRGSHRRLLWAELARYFHQLKILLMKNCVGDTEYWHLSGSRSGKQPVPPSPSPRYQVMKHLCLQKWSRNIFVRTPIPKFTWLPWPPQYPTSAVDGRWISLHFPLEAHAEPFIKPFMPLLMIRSRDRETELFSMWDQQG